MGLQGSRRLDKDHVWFDMPVAQRELVHRAINMSKLKCSIVIDDCNIISRDDYPVGTVIDLLKRAFAVLENHRVDNPAIPSFSSAITGYRHACSSHYAIVAASVEGNTRRDKLKMSGLPGIAMGWNLIGSIIVRMAASAQLA